MSGTGKKKKVIPDKCRSCMICYPKSKKDEHSDNNSSINGNSNDDNSNNSSSQ